MRTRACDCEAACSCKPQKVTVTPEGNTVSSRKNSGNYHYNYMYITQFLYTKLLPLFYPFGGFPCISSVWDPAGELHQVRVGILMERGTGKRGDRNSSELI